MDEEERYIMDDIDSHEWKILMDYVYMIDFGVDETLIGQDANDRSMCILLKGEAIVLKSHPIIGYQMVSHVAAGQVFGEIAFFNNKPRIATVVATEAGKYIKMGFDSYLRLVNEHPVIASKIVMSLALIFAARNRYANRLISFSLSA